MTKKRLPSDSKADYQFPAPPTGAVIIVLVMAILAGVVEIYWFVH